jgi:hypothetical protein
MAGNLPLFKNEKGCQNNKPKACGIIPFKISFEIKYRENSKNYQGNYLLYCFKLCSIKGTMAKTVCRNLEYIFKKCYKPGYKYYFP